jgi:hypothetical protein
MINEVRISPGKFTQRAGDMSQGYTCKRNNQYLIRTSDPWNGTGTQFIDLLDGSRVTVPSDEQVYGFSGHIVIEEWDNDLVPF